MARWHIVKRWISPIIHHLVPDLRQDDAGQIRRWVEMLVLTIIAAILLHAVHVPSAALFAGLLVSAGWALLSRAPGIVPPRAVTVSQAVLGVVIGGLVEPATMRALGAHWLPVVVVTFATLLASILAGLVLSLRRDVDPISGALALTAGGASAIVALARELGGDERMVAVVQYLRVGIVTASMPVIVALVFHTHAGAVKPPLPPPHDLVTSFNGILFLLVSCALGLGLARLTRLPAGSLLGPLSVAAVITLSGLLGHAAVPKWIINVAYVFIGWQAGVRFTMDRLRDVGRILPTAVMLIVVVNLVCALLGILLAQLAGVSEYDGYLATVPGGIYAALALAISSKTNVTFVLAVHVLRVIMMMFVMPVFAKLMARRVQNRS